MGRVGFGSTGCSLQNGIPVPVPVRNCIAVKLHAILCSLWFASAIVTTKMWDSLRENCTSETSRPLTALVILAWLCCSTSLLLLFVNGLQFMGMTDARMNDQTVPF
ncbi:hypothetical protein WOLCODRAFT_25568 [Wolfiporia cocos MD-104 SS10]|uniref:Uncharacterized protein n=1 Tax=Wolfiporia cocos (strain MD-104) TaxID=742152 RepID=A0A2H3JY65_WOLCO|nr:hypothetical protein WOLCODRAFT_25568 [Wolfiporia cocos MD-104 SS10]